MTAMHTPGPWHYGLSEGRGTPCVTSDEAWIAGEIFSGGMTRKEADANGRPIAAAPDLLSALKRLAAAYCDPGNSGSDHDDAVEAAHAVIAKAEGKE